MTITNTTQAVHLHRDDHPGSLHMLRKLANNRALPGYESTEYGAWVDWGELLNSYLSSTEKAMVHIARGIAGAETQGGFSAGQVSTIRVATIKASE